MKKEVGETTFLSIQMTLCLALQISKTFTLSMCPSSDRKQMTTCERDHLLVYNLPFLCAKTKVEVTNCP